MKQNKQRHAGFWIILSLLVLLLVLGVVLLVIGIRMGPSLVFSSPPVSI